MSTETTTKKWHQSKIVRLVIALFFGSGTFFLVAYNVVDQIDLNDAAAVSPEIQRGIELAKAGQWLSGLTAIAVALIGYFRIFKTNRFIALSLPTDIRKAA